MVGNTESKQQSKNICGARLGESNFYCVLPKSHDKPNGVLKKKYSKKHDYGFRPPKPKNKSNSNT